MSMRTVAAVLTAALLALGAVAACYLLRPAPTQPTAAPPDADPEVRFTDVTGPAGIRFRHETGAAGKKLLPETMGGGVAVIDFDRDGRPDLFFVNGCHWPGRGSESPKPTPALYRNKGDGTFEDVTAKVGLNVVMYGMGAAVGDYDNDGFPDLFVSCVGKHRLFHNDAGRGFTEVTDQAGVGGGGELPNCSWEEFLKWRPPIPFGSSAIWLDYDGDGKLDLFVCHYVTWSPAIDLGIGGTLGGVTRAYNRPMEFDGTVCKLFRNADGRRFEDVTEKAGLAVAEGEGARRRPLAKALGVVVCDPDGDGWPDVVVADDTVRNLFFHNVPGPDGGRVFREGAVRTGLAYAEGAVARGGMGIDFGEVTPGGHAVVITNFAGEPDSLFRQEGRQLLFADAAGPLGLAGPSRLPLKFGVFFFDYDLDGRLDLFTTNGHIEPDIALVRPTETHEQPAQLFRNTGDPRRLFEPVGSDRVGPDLFAPAVGRGAAYLDYDGDGAPDVALAPNGGPARLLRNDNRLGHHWLRLTLEGDGKRSNRSAIGAEVTVEAGGQVYRRTVAGARGYLSQSELTVTVGLGRTAQVDRVAVRWPGRDGGSQEWASLEPDRAYELRQGDPHPQPVSRKR